MACLDAVRQHYGERHTGFRPLGPHILGPVVGEFIRVERIFVCRH
jgi:hypothetical protein